MTTARGAVRLALDTSGSVGSVAVSIRGDVAARRLLERRMEHASLLVPTIERVLEDAGVSRRDLSGVVVGEGPGSFTGVRIGAATAKGLTRALGVPMWAVSSLAATALAARCAPIRYVLFDARSDRVYGACYEVGGGGVRTVVPPHAGVLGDALRGAPAGASFLGEGAERHRREIEGAGYPVADSGAGDSTAEGLLRFLALVPDHPPVADVAEWEPAYLRGSAAIPS